MNRLHPWKSIKRPQSIGKIWDWDFQQQFCLKFTDIHWCWFTDVRSSKMFSRCIAEEPCTRTLWRHHLRPTIRWAPASTKSSGRSYGHACANLDGPRPRKPEGFDVWVIAAFRVWFARFFARVQELCSASWVVKRCNHSGLTFIVQSIFGSLAQSWFGRDHAVGKTGKESFRCQNWLKWPLRQSSETEGLTCQTILLLQRQQDFDQNQRSSQQIQLMATWTEEVEKGPWIHHLNASISQGCQGSFEHANFPSTQLHYYSFLVVLHHLRHRFLGTPRVNLPFTSVQHVSQVATKKRRVNSWYEAPRTDFQKLSHQCLSLLFWDGDGTKTSTRQNHFQRIRMDSTGVADGEVIASTPSFPCGELLGTSCL